MKLIDILHESVKLTILTDKELGDINPTKDDIDDILNTLADSVGDLSGFTTYDYTVHRGAGGDGRDEAEIEEVESTMEDVIEVDISVLNDNDIPKSMFKRIIMTAFDQYDVEVELTHSEGSNIFASINPIFITSMAVKNDKMIINVDISEIIEANDIFDSF